MNIKLITYLIALIFCHSTVNALESLSNNEMDEIACQSGLYMKVDDENSRFEVYFSLPESPVKFLSNRVNSETIRMLEPKPQGQKIDALIEISGLAYNALVTKGVTDENGLNIAGTLAFEIPPYTQYYKVNVSNMFFDFFLANIINLQLVEDIGMVKIDNQDLTGGKLLLNSSNTAIPGTSLGKVDLTGFSIDITSPNELYFIYKTNDPHYR